MPRELTIVVRFEDAPEEEEIRRLFENEYDAVLLEVEEEEV